MAESILDQLKGLGGTWKKVKPRVAGDFQEIPVGDYECQCKVARLENAKSSGRLQVAWAFKVLKGSEKGKTIRIYQGLDSDAGDPIAWLKGSIKALGVNPPKKIVLLPKTLERCLEKKANITVQQNGTFTNKYINPFGKTKEDAEEEEDLDLEDL